MERKTPEFKLEAKAQGETEILLTRKFRAPREMVFRCFTDPKLLTQWLGCGMGKTIRCEIDTSIGGVWRHTMDLGAQGIFETFGQTLEFEPGERIVRTYIYNQPKIRECASTETATFSEGSEVSGVTSVQILIRHLNRENRDGHLGSGLEGGAGQSFDMLEQFLISR